jgi:hypothetical protein
MTATCVELQGFRGLYVLRFSFGGEGGGEGRSQNKYVYIIQDSQQTQIKVVVTSLRNFLMLILVDYLIHSQSEKICAH